MSKNSAPSKWYVRQAGTVRPAVLILIILLCALAIDALFIEPYWIQVDHSTVAAPVVAPLKIADLSDLHTRGIGRRERKLLAILDEEKPDVIVITGDTLASWGGNYERCREFYQALHAPLGVWVVRGNWENMRPLRHEHDYYEKAGVHLLLNGNQRIRSDVWLAGLDDPSSGTPKLDAALAGIPAGAYSILLFHAPGFFDSAAGRVNLCLTGHTHGGQVRLPFLPPFWLPSGCGRYLEGWYEEKGSRMFVSRGVGMSVLPVRFLCRPEISFITLEPNGKAAPKNDPSS